MFESIPWKQLLSMSAKGNVTIVVPEVVLRETARHWAMANERHYESLKTAIHKANRVGEILRTRGVDIGFAEIPPVVEPVIDVAEYIASIRERLERLQVCFPSIPDDLTIEAVLSRDLDRVPPFKDSGEGFRDTLIWETVKQVVSDAQCDESIFFVSNNTKDFCKEGRLHPELVDEIQEGRALCHVQSISSLLETTEIEPFLDGIAKSDADLSAFLSASLTPDGPSVIRQALIDAAEGLVGEDATGGRDELADKYGGVLNLYRPLGIPLEVDLETVENVQVDAASASWEAYETYEDGTMLVRGEINATLSVDAFVYKSDLAVTDEEGYAVLNADWNDHMANVEVTRPARLIFQLQLQRGSDSVDSCELEGIEPIDG